MEGSVASKSKVRSTLAMISKKKAATLDGIVTEILLNLEDLEINKITEINEIYDSGEMSAFWLFTIFKNFQHKDTSFDPCYYA